MKTHRTIPLILPVALLLFTARAEALDLVWIGGTGNWNLAGNWSPAQVPTAADNAWITNNGTYTVTVPAGSSATNNSLTLGGASGVQTLAVDRATLTLNGSSTVNANGQLTWLVAQSVVTGPGNLTVNGTLNWADGALSGSGAATISSGGTLAIGSGGVTLSRTLSNGGTASWAGGNLTISAGNTFNNLAGGTFDITADGHLMGASTTPINNSGLLRLTAGTTGTIITAPVNNSGTVLVLASTLNLNLGGTHTGIFSNSPSATLNFGGGSHSLNAGSLIAGGSLVTLGGAATLAASGTFGPGSTLNLISGVATLAASCDVTACTIGINGANCVVIYDSAGSVAALNLSQGTLGGTSPIFVTGLLTLGGGTVSNALVTANGGTAISGNTTLSGTKLLNPTTAIWSAGNITGANGAVVSNLLGGTFINSFDGSALRGAGAAPLFVNAGLFAKTNGTAAAGTTAIDFTFINTGTVEVQTNTLRYSTNQQTAGLTVLDGGALTVQAQPLNLLGGSLVGTGLVTVANTLNVVNSSSISPGLPVGELDISGNYQQTASGTLNITLGGYVPGAGYDLVTVSAGGAGGVATLAGTLNVALTNGFSPTNGATFTFLTATARAGSFSTFNYPSNDVGMQVSYDPTSAKVFVSNLKPVVANSIVSPAPVTYGSAFNFQFPANTFTDPDGNALTYSAAGMPLGITFNASTRTFSGAPAQTGVFTVAVAATDNGVPSLSVTNTFTVTVNPATLTVTAQSQSKTYGAADPALTFSATGFQLADTQASVLTGGLARAPGGTVAGGPYAITQGTLAANSNYTISFTGSTFSITAAPLSVSADPKTKIYGGADPAFTVSYAGFVNGETASVLGGTLSVARAPGQNVGNYVITPSGLTSANYSITFNTALLSITQAPLVVTADAKTKAYGAADPAFTASYSGFVNGETPAVLGGTLSFSRVAGENVGSYLVTPAGLTSANYSITFNTGSLTVTKALLTVTADAKSKTYGAADPAFTVTYSGFVNGDTSAALGGALTFSRAPGENVGGYLITPSGLTSSNYTLTFNTGTLTISKAPLSAAADAKSKVYGAADPVFTVTFAGFVNGDTSTALGGTLGFTRAPGETVGSYVITPGGLTSSNYTIAFNTGSLSITPAALSIAADAKSKTYGALDPAFTVTFTGLVNGDTPASLAGTLTFSRVPGENVGSYTITPSGLTSANYTITFNVASLTITRAPLSVTADSKTKTYGSIDPAFTVTYAGFVNAETPAVLGGTLTIVRTTGENAGSYLITPSGLTSGNYAITFNTGTLTIAKAPLSISADAKTKTYGAADPAFTVSYSGFVNSETPAVLSGTLSATRAAGENVGSYLITPSGVTNANYSLTFNTANLSITRATLAITAQARTKNYGAADPALTFSASGFQFADTQASVLTGSLTRAAGESVGGSPYAITQGTLAANGNYNINFTGSTLSITPAALSITADSETKPFGTPDPPFTVSYAGFVNGETSAVLGGTLVTTRAPGESPGSYAVTPAGLTSVNYAITFHSGTLTISAPAPVVLSLARSGVANVLLSWNAVSNATYRVQYKSSLNATNWTDLPGDVLAGATTASKLDLLTSSNRLYRVQLLP